MKKIILLCIPMFFFTTLISGQTILYFPEFSVFEGENDRKKAIVKATILLQKSIDYLYANNGGEIRFLGDTYELGYFSTLIPNTNWRQMNSTTQLAIQDLQNAIQANQISTVDKYLNNGQSGVYQDLFATSELNNSILGENLDLFPHYDQSILSAINQPSSLPIQDFIIKARNIEIQPPTPFYSPQNPGTPYIKFVPATSNSTQKVRFIAPRMPDITKIVSTQDQVVFDYINDHYLSLARINRPTTASKLIYALDVFTDSILNNTSSSTVMQNATVSIRNLVFPTSPNSQTHDLWQVIEKWNGCRAAFDAFDLFTTLQTYKSKYDAPALKFTSCIFDGNLEYGWEENDNYQFEQSSLLYVGANRNDLGRMVVDFSTCTWLDILGDGVHFHNCVKSKIYKCNGANVGRGAITATGQNADIRIDSYTDITYQPYYSVLSSIPNPDEIGKILLEIDSDAIKDDVFFKLSNSVLYVAKIVDERTRKDMTQNGGYYELIDSEIKYAFKQSVPKSTVLIEDCDFGSSTKSFSGGTAGSNVNISFNYAANTLINKCTFESNLHTIPYKSNNPNLVPTDYFVTINIQDTSQQWKNQRMEFLNCSFKNVNGELYRAIMIDGKNSVDDIANNNTVIFDGVSVDGNFHTGIQIGGGTVEIDNLYSMNLSRSNNARAYFLRRSPSNSRLIMRDINFLDASKFQFYYYYAASAVGKTNNTFEWEHDNVVLPQSLNIVERKQCSNLEYINFIGYRHIVGVENSPNDLHAPNNIKATGFDNDKYEATTGCIWRPKYTGCIGLNGIYSINWVKEPGCSSAKLGQGTPVQQIESKAVYSSTNSLDKELVRCYPNPSKGVLWLEMDLLTSETFNIELYNNTGQLLQSKKVISTMENRHSLDLSTYPSGLYLIRVQLREKTLSYKIIKE